MTKVHLQHAQPIVYGNFTSSTQASRNSTLLNILRAGRSKWRGKERKEHVHANDKCLSHFDITIDLLMDDFVMPQKSPKRRVAIGEVRNKMEDNWMHLFVLLRLLTSECDRLLLPRRKSALSLLPRALPWANDSRIEG